MVSKENSDRKNFLPISLNWRRLQSILKVQDSSRNDASKRDQKYVKEQKRENRLANSAEAGVQKEQKCDFFHYLPPAVAIDCEMVGVGHEGAIDALSRVSIVDENENVLLNTFVKPDAHVTDYRTKITGITWEDVKNAIPFQDVRAAVLKILNNKIVVGHALHNDFRCLMINHKSDLIRDTALYKPLRFNENANPRFQPSLKSLVKFWLSIDIQTDTHDSIEDAIAAMRLYKLKRNEWEKRFESVFNRKKGVDKSSVENGFSCLSEDINEEICTEMARNDQNNIFKSSKKLNYILKQKQIEEVVKRALLESKEQKLGNGKNSNLKKADGFSGEVYVHCVNNREGTFEDCSKERVVDTSEIAISCGERKMSDNAMRNIIENNDNDFEEDIGVEIARELSLYANLAKEICRQEEEKKGVSEKQGKQEKLSHQDSEQTGKEDERKRDENREEESTKEKNAFFSPTVLKGKTLIKKRNAYMHGKRKKSTFELKCKNAIKEIQKQLVLKKKKKKKKKLNQK